jgi:glycosyltransferase involved in cell wall biosynthesis
MDVDDFAAKMLAVAQDESLRQQLGRKSLARSAEFSWHRAAVQTLEALERVVSARKTDRKA